MMENGPEDTYTCPSFNSYSSERLAEIGGKVAGENGDTNDDEFEFVLAREENDVLPDEFFYQGQIGPVFPVFRRDLLLSYGDSSMSNENRRLEPSAEMECIKVPLSKLLEETRRDENDRDPASCSSSEADELESIPAGTYCVWRPKVPETPSPSRCKKSKSTGSASKRWKLPEFLRRSNSEGKDSLVFMTPKHRDEKRDRTETSRKSTENIAAVSSSTAGPPSAHEALYVQNRAKKENDRRKSYLPYRPDLVGFFASANGLRRSSPRF
ncbi:uncharacterized protein LOC142544800 [Primulina tabacum]|uniref:uncharacterized protein LOC142544800 n=1 Tax=Primulina tabacum TaxID=48773 RepID=UPI003F5969F8